MAKKLLMNNYRENGLMPVMDGLVCWLDGRDGSEQDAIWKDRSSNGNDGVLNGYNFKNDRWTGSSFYMNYTPNSNISMPSLFNYNIGTVEIYCNLIGTNSWNVVMGSELIFVNPTGHNAILCSKYGWRETASNFLDLNTNIQVAITFGENNLKIYKQGKVGHNSVGNFTPKPPSCDYLFKRINSSATFKGYVHSIRIYNRALTEEEIKQNYQYEQSVERYPKIVLCENYSPNGQPFYLWQDKMIDWDNYELYMNINLTNYTQNNWGNVLSVGYDINIWNNRKHKWHIYYNGANKTLRFQAVFEGFYAIEAPLNELSEVEIIINKNGVYLNGELKLHNNIVAQMVSPISIGSQEGVAKGIAQYNLVCLRKYQERG